MSAAHRVASGIQGSWRHGLYIQVDVEQHIHTPLQSSSNRQITNDAFSFSGSGFPHDPFQAFDALLKEIRGVHVIDFLYQTESQ